jgi:hypothetical protein
MPSDVYRRVSIEEECVAIGDRATAHDLRLASAALAR